MAEGSKQTARERASFARADRLKKEAAQTADVKEQQQKAGQQKTAEANKAADRQEKQRQAFEQRKAETRKQQQWKAFEQRKADDAKREFNRTAEDKIGIERKKDEQRKQDEQQQADRKREADQKAEQQKAQAKQEAQKRADERKAEAYVAAQARQQQADQIAEHRRQTSRLRTQHSEQSTSLKSRDGEAVDRHRNDIKTIDDRERRALKEFDVKRASLTGRAAQLIRGKAHFDGRREDIQKKSESDRLHKHRDLEALKERQFTAQQDQRLKHARERLDMMKTHRQHRDETQQQHDRDRPRLVAERQKAVEKNAEIERGHKQEQTQERGRGSMRNDFGR
jgi:colicin import membrane protein